MQPGQPEIEIPGLGSGLRLVKKKREKEQSPGVPGPSWLSGEAMGPGVLAQHSSRHCRRLTSPESEEESTTCSTSTGEGVHQFSLCIVPGAPHFTHSACQQWS